MRSPLIPFGLLLATASCSGLAAAIGGSPPPSPSEIAQLDSTDVRRVAHREQARFENTRWAHLPWTWYSRSGGDCAEIVGRFCLFFDGGGSTWEPPPEPEDVAEARQRLIETLQAASAAYSDDPWIIGQHVRYLLEAERFDEAEQSVRDCAAESWWCLALGGYVWHAREDFAKSEAMFDRALQAMPADERRRWTDLSVLLAPDAAKEYGRLDAAAREARERRFWELADPMISVPGNERRTEHLTRHVLARLAEDARSPERVSWGDDLHELLIRYGAAAGWQRVRPSTMSMARPSVVSHFEPGGRELLPAWDVTMDPTAASADGWIPDAEYPRTEYAPAYADRFHDLEHQVAMFRRDDSVRVVAAWRVPSDSFPDTAMVTATLAAGLLDAGTLSMRTHELQGARGAMSVVAPARPLVVSLELLAHEERHAARARFGVRPPWRADAPIAVSDLLIITPREPLPVSLDEAIPLARASTRLDAGERIGVFWEMYGPDEAPRQAFLTLSVTRGEEGWTRRLFERVGLADRFDGLRLQWEERVGAPVTPRAVVLDFARLEPGSYTLELVVAPVGRPSVTVTRVIEIRR